jgi:aspartyl/asparaginyl beta-hydroxylase (cupin superfamily)/thioredoxin-like negative regulator of GroEL
VNTAAAAQPDEAAIIRLLQASKAEAAAGRMAESDRLLAHVARQAPNHPAILNELGVRMMTRGSPEQAHALFVRATTADPRHPALWANLASSLKALGRADEEMNAIEKALELEPRHLSALLQYAQYYERHGKTRQAARAYQNALATLPPNFEPPEAVREALTHAKSVVESDQAALWATLEGPLAAVRERHGGRRQRRVDRCLDILMGKSRAFHSQPTWMYFPELPEIDFFERAEFPWLDAIEAATEEIRAELMRVLVADRDGLQPYIDFPASMPLDQWRDLNRSRRWSAYFLWNQGEANAAHIARCPVTARVLESAPRCRVASRAPTAFFSILDANTQIPAHTGVTNTRCTVHLPLIVPPGCRFRVGATTREWVPGQAWVFDDTIEHEAWNDSDTPRGILIFDVWNPLLTAAERDMIQAANEAYVRYYGDVEGGQPG